MNLNYTDQVLTTSGLKPIKIILCPKWIVNSLVKYKADLATIFQSEKIFDFLSINDISELMFINNHYKIAGYDIGDFDFLNRIVADSNVSQDTKNKYKQAYKQADAFNCEFEGASECGKKHYLESKLNTRLRDANKDRVIEHNPDGVENQFFKIITVMDGIVVVLEEGFLNYIEHSEINKLKVIKEICRLLHATTDYRTFSSKPIFDVYVRLLANNE